MESPYNSQKQTCVCLCMCVCGVCVCGVCVCVCVCVWVWFCVCMFVCLCVLLLVKWEAAALAGLVLFLQRFRTEHPVSDIMTIFYWTKELMMSIIIVMAAFVQKCHFSETWAHHLRRCDVWLTLMKDEHFLWIRSILLRKTAHWTEHCTLNSGSNDQMISRNSCSKSFYWN